MATTTQKSGLTFKHKVGYAMGDLGGCMTFALMGAMVTRYYTNVLQVNTAVLATLLLVWNIWDAVNDPMMGALMDKMYAKHHNKNGKFRPWLLRAAPLLAITSIVFWTVPTLFDGYTMLVVLFFCKILYEGCYTMFNIPMGSLLSAMANTDGERAALREADWHHVAVLAHVRGHPVVDCAGGGIGVVIEIVAHRHRVMEPAVRTLLHGESAWRRLLQHERRPQ